MDAASVSLRGARSNLSASFKQWRAKAGAALDPVKESVERTTLSVLGIWDLVEANRKDCHELAERLSWITEQVLARLPPEMDDPPSIRHMLDALRQVVGEVETYLRTQRSVADGMVRFTSTDDSTALHKKLDAVMLEFAVVQAVDVRERLDKMRLEQDAGSLAVRVPADLPLVNLPPKPAKFYGRDELVETIVQSLIQEGTCRIPLLGPGGIGKTSAAAAVMNDVRVRRKYGQDIIFVSCEGVSSAEGILRCLTAALGIRHESDALWAVFTHLSSKVYLLVLDNLETAWDSEDRLNVEELLAKLAQVSSLSLIVTMRGALRPNGVEWVEPCPPPLEPLSLDAARHMWIGIAGTADERLDELLALLDGLPLAINLMAHQGQLMGPSELIDAYKAEKTTLLARGGKRGRLTRLDVSIQLSLNSHSISENANAPKLLSTVCLLPDGVLLADVARMLPSMSNTRQTTLLLMEAALAVRQKQRIKVLSPIRDFILDRYPPGGSCLSDVRRYFIVLALQGSKIGTDESKQAVDLLSAEFGNINSVLIHFWQSSPSSEEADTLLTATERFAQFSHLASYGDCTILLSQATTVLKAAGKEQGVARCMQMMGHLLGRQDRYQDMFAMLEGAKAAFLTMDDRLGAAQCTYAMGGVLLMLHRCEEAVVRLHEAKATFEAIGDPLGAARCTRSMGDVLHMLGRFDEAIAELEDAKVTFEGLGDRLWAAQCTRSIGDVLRVQGRYEEAIINLEEARMEYESIGNRLGPAQCLRMIGDALRMQARYDKAILTLVQAKAEYEAVGNQLGEAQCILSMGDLYRMEGRYGEAVSELEEAKRRFMVIGYRFGIAECNRLLAQTLITCDQRGKAGSLLRQAMNIYIKRWDCHGRSKFARKSWRE
ncbi:TPR-like protein [Calocera viscosa TUFC12733]|uniref:TPR-like protein n=1 Tax=Calocera viscosa (strain TUFC12733) TaxID=1330018 RepID=A0A167G811_CALVF|nr:TPR-like protein [Calocera viscosa TUFC12733]